MAKKEVLEGPLFLIFKCIEHDLELFVRECNAFSHLCMVGTPGPDIILSRSTIKTHTVQFFGPTLVIF